MPPSRSLDGLSALKIALMAQEARGDAQVVLRADPIAVVGMACRVPGGGDSVEAFWDLLARGGDAVGDVPADRWDVDQWASPDPSVPGRAITRAGAFLDRIDAFDADYFGILPREAERMDPQQRLFLEVACEALDDAGLVRERLAGSRSGVFVASYHNDYTHLQFEDPASIDPRTLTGTLHSVLANRLSYLLDLRGPSLSIDTACSSSLVAIHLACQSLRFGESDMAVAGGVSLMIAPQLVVAMSKVGFMAPDGRCKTFDASADGFGRGEGCGVVVLKRLADAVADGDRVLGVIRGSAVNQDGHSTVLAAPHGPAQEALIREALAASHLAPGRIGLMETHGTGTALGDPIEVEAVAATIGQPSSADAPCYLGAAKANIGHLEAAAGVVGLIKAILTLRHDAIPRQIHFTRLNPHISLAHTRLRIPETTVPWPRGPVPRCAAVSSFGVGGTNAHVIVEEAPTLPGPDAGPAGVTRLLPLSAQTPAALDALVARWIAFLGETDHQVADLCYTAAERRHHYRCRLAVAGRTTDEWRARLIEHARSSPAVRPAETRQRLAFVFSGQGPQWYAMGRDLLAGEPVFREAIEACDSLLRPLAGWSLIEELERTEADSRLDRTDVAQPAIFALQVALVRLWHAWGVTPDGVAGHSVGEIAALHAAGALALPDAIRIVWHRGRIMQAASDGGRMAQIAIDPTGLLALIAPHGDRLSLAAINAPQSVVVSGEAAAVDVVLAECDRRGIAHRALPVRYAFHSQAMAPLAERLAVELDGLRTDVPVVPYYSTVTGGQVTSSLDAGYFRRNVRETVRLSDAVTAMAADGFGTFVEIGPHPVLGAAMTETLECVESIPVVMTSLRRGRPERDTMLQACAGLYAAGLTPDWAAFQRAEGDVVSLPAYPWQRQRYWLDRRDPTATHDLPVLAAGAGLLGRAVDVAALDGQVFEAAVDVRAHWLADHRLFGTVLLPAAAMFEACASAVSTSRTSAVILRDVAIERPLVMPADRPARWQTVVQVRDGATTLAMYAPGGPGSGWTRIVSATTDDDDEVRERAVSERDGHAHDIAEIYDTFERLGVTFGPRFRCLSAVRRGEGWAEATIDLPAAIATEEGRVFVHPVVVDAAIQVCSVIAWADRSAGEPAVLLPVAADRVLLGPSAARQWRARVVLDARQQDAVTCSLWVHDEGGEVVAAIDGLRFRTATAAQFAGTRSDAPDAYEIAWRPVDLSTQGPVALAGRRWLLFADETGVGDRLATRLRRAGASCVRVIAGHAFARTAPDAWTMRPDSPDDMTALFDAVGDRWQAIVHLWSLDVPPTSDADEAALAAGDARQLASALHLVQAAAAAGVSETVLALVTRGAVDTRSENETVDVCPRAAGLWGFGGVIAVEHPEWHVRRIDLASATTSDDEGLVAGLTVSSGPRSLARRGRQWWAPRFVRRQDVVDAGPQRVAITGGGGTIDHVTLVAAPRPAIGPDDLHLRVLASGLNFRDVLMAVGMYEGRPVSLGAECAGIVEAVGARVRGVRRGDRVFGYTPGSLATDVVVPAAFVWPIPDGLSAVDAAALPVAYLTAWHGLHRLADLRAGERVLIHAATGGVGLAAVHLARRAGAEIFATAGSDEKRSRLRAMGVAHVMDSRSPAFADEVERLTAGAGVDVVLNSLTGPFIDASVRVTAQGGRFLELGKRAILSADEMAVRRPDIRYFPYDLGTEAEADPGLLPPMFSELVAAIADGTLPRLPTRTFPLAHTADAMRVMARAHHIGKLVVVPSPVDAEAPLVSEDATYLITGGLGAIGLATARWLATSGARAIVLVGRSAPGAGAQDVIDDLRREGVTIRVEPADVADAGDLQRVLAGIARDLPPLRGVVHAAGALHDGTLATQRWHDAQGVLRGKVHGAWALHHATKAMPLDFFVLYSAAGTHLGPAGQGLYPAANAELDAIAQRRRREGLPALSVGWGIWGEGGMAAQASVGSAVWRERGLGPIASTDAFRTLERLLRTGATTTMVLTIDWQRFGNRLPVGLDPDVFADVLTVTDVPSAEPALASSLRALPPGDRPRALVARLTSHVLAVIGLDGTSTIDSRAPLRDLGLDSLMAVELRNTLARLVGQPLPATLLFDYPTLGALATRLLAVMGLDEPDAARAPVADDTGARALAALSDDEAEALLLAELEASGPDAGDA
ncbi:MAG: hypothetical protein ABS36_15900 [Acidobacteria bacterium SCN 69-37]|nr:MAG: hypothetical protein ABS36_15900 [Acidobacteria bacterium SCN 69-37]